jgi:hypothetical protein
MQDCASVIAECDIHMLEAEQANDVEQAAMLRSDMRSLQKAITTFNADFTAHFLLVSIASRPCCDKATATAAC